MESPAVRVARDDCDSGLCDGRSVPWGVAVLSPALCGDGSGSSGAALPPLAVTNARGLRSRTWSRVALHPVVRADRAVVVVVVVVIEVERLVQGVQHVRWQDRFQLGFRRKAIGGRQRRMRTESTRRSALASNDSRCRTEFGVWQLRRRGGSKWLVAEGRLECGWLSGAASEARTLGGPGSVPGLLGGAGWIGADVEGEEGDEGVSRGESVLPAS